MRRHDPIDTYLAYLPRLLLQSLEETPSSGQPVEREFSAAVLFADISGFTALTERLAARGAEGVEELSAILNAYFGRIIDTIHAHGGDVIKFAGDALLAVWVTDETSDLSECVRRTAQCGLAIQAGLRDYSAPGNTRLTLRAAIGAGPMRMLQIGGVYQRQEPVIAGEPLLQVGACSHIGQPGEVVVSAEAWQVVNHDFDAQPREQGVYCLLASRQAATLLARPSWSVSDSLAQQVKRFVPAAIHHRVEAGQGIWLAELRRITVLFINLPDMHYGTPLAEAQQAMQTLQQALYRYEGSVNKLSVDDKGVSLLAVYGLPPLSHNDDPGRGVRAALDIREQLESLGWQYAIGVTTGRAFCGSIGNEQRCEYTIMGDVVNLAARLMQKAKNSILVDEPTASMAEHIEFEAHAPLTLKGKARPVSAFRPLAYIQEEESSAETELVGRDAEQQQLQQAMSTLHSGGSSVAIVDGEAGIGKTSLTSWLKAQATTQEVMAVRAFASAIDKNTPYYAWSGLLEQLFAIRAVTDSRQRGDRVLAYLDGHDELQRLAPLMNDILSLQLSDNEVTRQLAGEARADNVTDFIIGVLRFAASRQPLLLMLDNAHWMDSASWSLIRQVVRDVSPLMLVLVTRTLVEPLPKTYRYLKTDPDTVNITLGSLSAEDTYTLSCRVLAADAVEDDVRQLFDQKSHGNPFFIEQIANSLQEIEAVRIINRTCMRAEGVPDLSSLNLPDTLEGMITERIDRLGPSQQLVLKVASVIGNVFRASLLRDVYPIDADRERLDDVLEDFVRLGFLVQAREQSAPSYVFSQILVQEVAYNLMLFAQRQQLHEAIAQWYERTYPDKLAPYYSLLVYHYGRVNDDEKHLEYCVKAGEQAVRNFANIEALELFDRVFKLDEKLGFPTPDQQRASWYQEMGEAHYALASFNNSRRCLSEALRYNGEHIPAPGRQLITALLKEIWQQFLQRMRAGYYFASERNDAVEQLAVARGCERIAQIEYMNNDRPNVLYFALRALNLSERVGTSAELARSYANICVVAGMIPSYALAELYYRLARSTSNKTHNLPSQAYVYMVTAMYRTTTAQWQDIRESVEPGIDIALRIGDRRRWDELMFTLAPATYRLGKHSVSLDQYEELYQSGVRRGILQIQAWGLSGKLVSAIPSGEYDEIVARLEALDFDTLGSGDQILANGALAQAWWRKGEERKALAYADRAAALMASADAVAQYVLEGFVGTIDTYLGICERDHLRLSSLRGRIKSIMKALANYARIYTVGQPALLRYRGRLYWLEGKRRKARQAWQKGLERAQEYAMRYETALLHYEIGRHMQTDERQQHLSEARDSFEFAGAMLDYDRVRDELK
jgi:predicted ATPase/class 3 adenylate cyclase